MTFCTLRENLLFGCASGVQSKTEPVLLLFFGLMILVAMSVSGTLGSEVSANSPIMPDSEHVELVGHLGGSSQVVFVEGSYAYMGFGSQLVIIEISDPSHPVRIGYMMLPVGIEEIVVVENLAYVAAGDLHIVDVSNPAAPIIVGSLATPTYDVTVVDGYAYLVAGDLRVVDISNPAAASEVGFLEIGYASKVAVMDDYAYVMTPDSLHVIDISIPTSPIEVGRYTASSDYLSALTDLAVAENYAYLTEIHFGTADFVGLNIVDISNPAEPVEVDYYSFGIGSEIAVTVDQQYLYLVSQDLLTVLDLRDPANLTRVSHLRTPGSGEDIAVAGSYAYIADGARGLRVLHVSDFNEVGAYDSLGSANDVVERNGYIYVADKHSIGGGLKVVDFANPTAPTVVGTDPESGRSSVFVSDDYAYLPREKCEPRIGTCDAYLDIVDISQAAAPSKVGSYYIPNYYYSEIPRKVAVAGQHVYLTDEDGLYVLDVSKPAAPSQVALYELQGANDIALAENIAVIAAEGTGLQILNISDTITPTLVGAYESAGEARGITVADQYAYLADGKNGLRIIEISDPSAPSEVGSFSLLPEALDVAVSGDFAFVASGSAGLRIIDIANPAAATEVGFYDTPGEAVAVGERYIYVADNQAGLLILQFGHAIGGRIVEANDTPFAGVTVAASSGMTVTSDATGEYMFVGSAQPFMPGSYTLTPRLPKGEYAFFPPTYTVTVPPDAQGQDFVILSAPLSTTLQPGLRTMLTVTDTQGLPTQLDFPADAVTLPTTLHLTPTVVADEINANFAAHAFELTVSQEGESLPDFTFNAPVTVTIRYSEVDMLPIGNENELALWWWTGSAWQDATETCHPATLYRRQISQAFLWTTKPVSSFARLRRNGNNEIAVSICRAGRLALFGPGNKLFLPLIVTRVH